ncbi:isopentenyl diphosphate isomerase/L-lactate dehydrogenase-like FMN-dependent dehydrogenase [Bradyrhizobium sp. RT4b]
MKLIASGGIRDAVDVAKAIRLGADIAGQAAGVLRAATMSTEAVVAHFEIVIRQLAVACYCTGSADLAALRQARLLPSAHLPAGRCRRRPHVAAGPSRLLKYLRQRTFCPANAATTS